MKNEKEMKRKVEEIFKEKVTAGKAVLARTFIEKYITILQKKHQIELDGKLLEMEFQFDLIDSIGLALKKSQVHTIPSIQFHIILNDENEILGLGEKYEEYISYFPYSKSH